MVFFSSLPTTSDEEIEAENLVKRGEIDQAIAIYQCLSPASSRSLHHLGVLYAENKGDQCTAINYFQQALQMKEEVYTSAFLATKSLRLFFL